MSFFNKAPEIDVHQQYSKRLAGTRLNILLLLILTVVNILISVTGGSSYFLFSIAVPYYLTCALVAWTGHLPQEIYDDPANGWEGFEFWPDQLLYVAIVISVMIMVLYLLCWLFSKNHYGWIIASAALFALDCLSFPLCYWFFGFDASDLIDIFFHVYILGSMIVCIASGIKASKTPMPEPMPVAEVEAAPSTEAAPAENASDDQNAE